MKFGIRRSDTNEFMAGSARWTIDGALARLFDTVDEASCWLDAVDPFNKLKDVPIVFTPFAKQWARVSGAEGVPR